MIEAGRPISLQRPKPVARTAARALAAVLSCAVAIPPAAAQDTRPGTRDLPVIRDAEIEQLLREYTVPLLRAAHLAQQNVRVVIINDRSFNAFVADGRRIFVNAGALMDSATPNQIIGVFAHEIGHIAGGHLSRMRQEIARAQTASILALLLGAGALAAGAATRSGSMGQIGAAALSAPQQVIQRSLLSYQRAQEEQADRAAVKFLTATQQSPKGMYDTFKRFANDTMFFARHVDPYLQSHPMPAERVAALENLVKTSPFWDKMDPPQLQLRHDMMRAKLHGFLDAPGTVLNRYPLSNTSLPARYARAISAYRFSDQRNAMAQIDALIRSEPNNPYFHELKGQALLEWGHPADAIAPLRRAVALAPSASLIRMMLGQAMVATNDRRLMDEAIPMLRQLLIREPEAPQAYRYLAMAYGRKGDLAQADLASAQAAFVSGDFVAAHGLAERAKSRFPAGSPGWVRADDIARFKPPTTLGRKTPR